MLANDGAIFAPERASAQNKNWTTPGADSLIDLATGHFAWLDAMEEKGCSPMQMLHAASRNIAIAYGKSRDLGTLEVGKIADLLILARNPLEAAANYRTIESVIKDGAIVDRNALPLTPILTKPLEHADEEASYKPFVSRTAAGFPMCPMCAARRQ
jgi:adenine deaminase